MWAASLLIAGLIGNSYMPVVMRVKKSSECVSAVLEIFRIGGMLTSDLHIFALAMNQFIGIMWPLKYKMMITTRRIRLLIFLLWIVPVLFLFAWFVALENDGLRHPKCVFMFYSKLPFRLTIFLFFIIPLLATYALYAIILSTLLKVKAKCDINGSIRLTASTHAGFAAIQVTGYAFAEDPRRANHENSQDDFLFDFDSVPSKPRRDNSVALRHIAMNGNSEDLSLLSGLRRKKREMKAQQERV
ncbi:hypothetical protein QR680_002899 [Steinernema hermaphroditum]|uniref:G-protein coupled receptors family 1 profile domain-containing protein n=1 Tax=Steinernema hermaphroditum TaxID=289476 RepID=A0AA39H4I3_9BILA|nr:hypothetical protein QR680_002899 [Steinernema hermaphroditum]